MTYMLIKQVLILLYYFLPLEETRWASDEQLTLMWIAKVWNCTFLHVSASHATVGQTATNQTSAIRKWWVLSDFLSLGFCVKLLQFSLSSCEGVGLVCLQFLICTGSTCQTAPACFFFSSLSITHFPLCLISSDPQCWKVQRPAGQSDGHWTDATRRAVTGSSPSHVSTNQGDLWAEPLRFSFSCNEGRVWGSLSWLITKINEMGGRMKVVWLLPFNDLVGFILL